MAKSLYAFKRHTWLQLINTQADSESIQEIIIKLKGQENDYLQNHMDSMS